MSYEAIFDERGIADDLLAVFREGRPPVVRDITDVLMGRRRGEVVRCRDCHWAKPEQSDHEYRAEYRCNMWIADVEANGFCFRGRKRSES